jgi:group I intron endonuclease
MVVYQITNKINGKVYIGKSVKFLRGRWAQHRKDAESQNPHTLLAPAIAEHGPNAFSIQVLRHGSSKSELAAMEEYEIFAKRSIDPNRGYNRQLGRRPMWKDTNGTRLWQQDLDDFAELLAKSFTPGWKQSRR